MIELTDDQITLNNSKILPSDFTCDFGFSLRRNGSSLVLTLQGEFDLGVSESVYNAISDAYTDPECKDLIADLSMVTFMDSTGLGMFLNAAYLIRARGGSIYIAGCQPSVRRGFAVTRLDKIFHVSENVSDVHQARQTHTDQPD